jgi:OOP family OmpA-OmpF porin
MKKSVVFMSVLVLFCVMVCSGNALAGSKAGGMTITPSVGGYAFDSKKGLQNDGRFYNLGLGYNFTDHISGEAIFGLVKTKTDCNCQDIDAYLPRIEALYHFFPDKMFVPYLAVGGGYLFYNDDEFKKKIDNSPILDYGLGVKVFLTDNLALRGDARHFYDTKNSVSDFGVTVGVTYQFGGETKKKPEPPPEVKKPEKKVYEQKMEKKPEIPQEVKGSDKKLPPPPMPVKPEIRKEEKVEVTVLFDFDKTIVKPMYNDQLKKVADFMKANPAATAKVEGHTDNIGSAKYNSTLSRKRAQSVKNYLVKNFKVDSSRIIIEGLGSSKPAADNKTEEGRKQNRRAITISITK